MISTMKIRKIGALLTLFCFVINGSAYPQQASPVDSAPVMAQAVSSSSAPTPRLRPDVIRLRSDLNPYNIAIASESGKIDEVFQGKSDSPLIVHVQDAHANYQAQVNIKKIIHELVEKYGFSLVQLEGAVSKLDPDALKPSYLQEANVKLADFLMREGRITGADAYAVEAGKSVELYGIEDQLLYLENIRMFKQIYSHQDEINAYFNSVHDAFDNIGRKLFTPGQLDFTRKTEEFFQDKIDLLDYLLYLNGVAEKTGPTHLKDLKEMVHYPNLVRIMRLHAIEKQMDQSALKKEGAALKQEFAKRDLLSEEVDQLFDRLDDPQKGTKPRDYFVKLTEVADQGQIEFLSYPQLRMFAEYLIYRDEIDHQAVFSELLRYKTYLESELFTEGDEKKLLEAIDFAGLLEQYFRLEMSREKIARYLEHRDQINPSFIALRLNALAAQFQVSTKPFGDLAQLDAHMGDVEYFYQLVLKRDEVFIDKVISRMRSLGQDKTILVTGGFHKDGMTEHFRKQDLSYVVISPKVGVEQGSENYVKVMLDQDIVVGGAFTGSFAIGARALGDPALADEVSNYLRLNFAAATVALARTLDSTLSQTKFSQFSEARLKNFIKANGDQISIRPLDPGIRGNLATVYFPVKFFEANKPKEGILRAEVRTDTLDFIVTLIESKEGRGNQGLVWPQNRIPELGNPILIHERFNLSEVSSLISPNRQPDTPSRPVLDLDNLPASVFPLDVFVPLNAPVDLGEVEAFQALYDAPVAANRRVRESIIEGNALDSDAVSQASAAFQVGRLVTEDDVAATDQLDESNKNVFEKLYSATVAQEDVFLVAVLDLQEEPQASRAQLLAILGELEANRKAAFAVYGAGVREFAAGSVNQKTINSEAFKRILFVDEHRIGVPIRTLEEAIDLAAKQVQNTPGSWMNHRLANVTGAERLSGDEFMQKTGILVPTGEAGIRFRNAIANRWSDTLRVLAIDMQDVNISGDRDLEEAIGDFQIRVLSRLRLVDVGALLKELGVEAVRPDGQNQFRIINSSAVRTLVKSLYMAFVAISKAA
jgi:hypothetical protein